MIPGKQYPDASLGQRPAPARTRIFWWLFICPARGLAVFLCVYSLLSLGSAVLFGAYNQNAWWIDFSFLPPALSALEQLALTVALGMFSVRIPRHIITRLVMAVPVFVAFVIAVSNTVAVYAVAAEGSIILGFPLPFSLFVGIGLLSILVGILVGVNSAPEAPRRARTGTVCTIIASVLVTGVFFPLGQMHCFGTTDYRVPVDAAVVFGAQVYPDGTPSPVLQDRLDTAISFYQEGYAPVLVMSGGIDVDGTSEARAMRDYAVRNGVAADDILMDEQGSTTERTAQNTVGFLHDANMERVAAVSNFYHLARIKMLYLAEGMDVVTVPSVPNKDPDYPLYNVVREIPGWWYYWLLNLVE